MSKVIYSLMNGRKEGEQEGEEGEGEEGEGREGWRRNKVKRKRREEQSHLISWYRL